ncbi:hypothetical protein, partial [Actinomadura sp. KC216]|uniref:hypothetical protein n=1 Tax=Actinomadura sp. KC216 TaxID=2530370 RepID=UPI001A9DA9F4
GQGPPPPPHPGMDPYQPRYDARRRHDGSATVANVVRVVTGTVAAIFLLHILFVVFDANQGNGFVHGVYNVAKALVLGLGDVFTPDDATLGVVLNYGFAALLYLVVGQLIVRALNRH